MELLFLALRLKLVFMLNSAEHEIISREIFMLSYVKQERISNC